MGNETNLVLLLSTGKVKNRCIDVHEIQVDHHISVCVCKQSTTVELAECCSSLMPT